MAAFESCGFAWINHHIGFKVHHQFNLAHGHVEQQSKPGWKTLQKPDVRNRARQFNVPHTLSAHLGVGDFNTAFLANHALMFQALVLAALTFVVLDRTEQFRAKQPVTLRFKRPVIDGFRFSHLTVRPAANFFRRCQPDSDFIKILELACPLHQVI